MNKNIDIKLTITKNDRIPTWDDIPLGWHRGKLVHVGRITSRKGQRGIGLKWSFYHEATDRHYSVYGRYYGGGLQFLSKGLQFWLGDSLSDCLDDNDEVIWEKLLDLEADISVEASKLEGMEQPMVLVQKIAAPGTHVKGVMAPLTYHEKVHYGLN